MIYGTLLNKFNMKRVFWTFVFLVVCTVVFILELIIPLDYFAFVPKHAFSRPWTFITSVFLHANVNHLIFNMFALFMFGIFLESKIKERDFVFIFFLAGIAGNLAYMMTSFGGSIPAVGASGAIYGIMGCLAVMAPFTVVVYVGGIPMPMIAVAFFWGISEFFGIFTPSMIGHEAHLAGLIVGIIFALNIRKRRKIEHIFG